MKKYFIPALIFFLLLQINLFAEEERKKGNWYRIEKEGGVNSIYVDYKSIKKKEGEVSYKQMEFLLEKQKLEGTDKEYKFVVSKRTGDCKNKAYRIDEEKYFDVEVNKEKDEIKEELIYKNDFDDKNDKGWVEVIPNTLIEKVWRFTCLYKDE